jgi:ubiquinone biosynthesis protein COQ9
LNQHPEPPTLSSMSEQDFDHALIAAAFQRAADVGWARLTIADAAREAGLSLAEARERFPSKHTLFWRFGRHLDQAALASASAEGPARDRLFDLLMSRFDGMKPHRAGVRALLRHLPSDPLTTLELTCATRRSMRWMLNAVGLSTFGLRGRLRIQGLMAVWLWAFRAFQRDESEDLSATMAALDTALNRACRAASWLSGERSHQQEEDASAVSAEPDPLA